MTDRSDWKFWFADTAVAVIYRGWPNGVQRDCVIMTLAEARELRDLLDEMVPEKDPKVTPSRGAR